MNKLQLQEILSQPFQIEKWISVLKDVFSVRNILQKPSPIQLNSNNKAEAAYELGSFNTSDDRIIGLYLVKVKPQVWLERNKVGLRELLRSIYKYEVDGALIVFEQQDKWRLSFVSEIRTFDELGHITKKITEPKRYTYLLGKGEKIKTPVQRLAVIAGKTISLEDIRNAFSVETLNEEFYKIVAKRFYQLVGATEGKGTKAITYDRVLKLPGVDPHTKEGNKIYQEFAVRLIGRTVFCWFLKVKKSKSGLSLLPEHLLSSDAVKANGNYYHFILEKLFFQTLNTPMDERLKNLPEGSEQVPFLNGGLFEPQTEDYYKPNRVTGLSDNLNTLAIPDNWFTDFFLNLEQYNFTIDENSVVDVEVSVDPEMLGRIFENLLAEIDPDSGDSARKATGSFYTPREIVDYMATESLVHYLHNQTAIDEEKLHPIFKIDSEVSFTSQETEKILEALDQLKVLDPACGSGAFPMGVLQKIVMALQKIDKDAVWWKRKQIQKIDNAILRKQVKEKLEQTTVEYARKIGIIQNSLYGVDIQPIAAEISKLRCFLTLIVDENIDETKPNRGVEPLPNLEFKFVTADTLLKLPPEQNEKGIASLFGNQAELEELQEIRLDYLQSYGEHKKELKERFLELQRHIFKQQLSFGAKEDSRAYQISSWNPFSHDKVDWFDPLWMYGVKEFDIVVGNPPYVQMQKDSGRLAKQLEKHGYDTFERTGDIYSIFFERGTQFLNDEGILCYITSNKWMRANYGASTRQFFSEKTYPLLLIDFGNIQIFDTATVDTSIMLLQNKPKLKKHIPKEVTAVRINDDFDINNQSLVEYVSGNGYALTSLSHNAWVIGAKDIYSIKNFVESQGIQLKEWEISINYGIKTGLNDAFIIDNETKESIVKQDPKSLEILKPILRGRDFSAWYPDFGNLWLINSHNGVKSLGIRAVKVAKEYPVIYKWLLNFRTQLEKRNDSGDDWTNLRNCAYIMDFEKPKIMYPNMTKYLPFIYDDGNHFYSNDKSYILLGKNLKYLTCFFNSKLFKYCFSDDFPELQGGTKELRKVFFDKIPVKQINNEQEKPFAKMVDYLVTLKKEKIREATDQFMYIYFEQIANALVFELYFKEEFVSRHLSIAEHIAKLPDLNDAEKNLHQLRKIYVFVNQDHHPVKQAIFSMLSIPQIELIMNSVEI